MRSQKFLVLSKGQEMNLFSVAFPDCRSLRLKNCCSRSIFLMGYGELLVSSKGQEVDRHYVVFPD